jgi:hypothetical protein
MNICKSVGNKNLAHLFPEARGETQMRRSPRGNKASNPASPGYESCGCPGRSAKCVEGTFFRYMEGSVREGPDWTDETREGSCHLSAWGTHPRGSSIQERDRGRRDQAEVPQGRPPQDHADSTQGNNPRRDEGLRSDLPLYHNGEMDEAEPDIKEIEFRTTGLVQEEGEPGEAGRSRNPCNQSPSPSPPIPGSQGADTQPKH